MKSCATEQRRYDRDMNRPVIHLSETEAIHDFASVLRHIDLGSEVVVERVTGLNAVIQPIPRHGRPLSECLQLAAGSKATLDPGFSADLEALIRSHESLSSSWE